MDFTQSETAKALCEVGGGISLNQPNVASHISMTVHELGFELFQQKYGVSLIQYAFSFYKSTLQQLRCDSIE